MTTSAEAKATLAAALVEHWTAPAFKPLGELHPAADVPRDAELPHATFHVTTREAFATSASGGHDHLLIISLHAHCVREADALAATFHDLFFPMALSLRAGRVTIGNLYRSARGHTRDVHFAELSFDVSTTSPEEPIA